MVKRTHAVYLSTGPGRSRILSIQVIRCVGRLKPGHRRLPKMVIRWLETSVHDVAHGCSPKDLVKRLGVVEYNT